MWGQSAEELLGMLAQLPPGFLPAVLFDAPTDAATPPTFDRECLTEGLAALEEAGELERKGERLRLPAEVRERVLMELEYGSSAKAVATAIGLVLSAFPSDPGDYAKWERSRALMPALRGVVERVLELEIESPGVPLALALGSEYLTASGDYPDSRELAQSAFDYAPASLEPGLEATMNHALGVILTELGELEQARRALERAREARTRIAEVDAAAAREDELALGEALGELGDFAAARQRLERVRTDAEVPVDRFDARARRRLGWLAMEEGDLEEAERIYRQTLAETEELLGAAHPDVAQTRGELGALLLESSRWEEARTTLEDALACARHSLGDEHPAVAVIASNLGGALEGLERFAEAREAVELSLSVGREVLPAGHRNLWLRHRKLARILRSLDEPEEACRHAEAAASISETALPPEDREAARDQLALAAALTRLGQRVDARRRYESALPLLEAAEGPRSPEVAQHQLTYGEVLIELGDLVAARPQLERAHENSEVMEGAGAIRARIALLNLARRLADERAAALERLGLEVDATRERDSDLESRRSVLEEIAGDSDINSTVLAAHAAGTAMADLAETALAQAQATAEAFDDEEERAIGLEAVRLAWGSLGLDAYMAGRFDESRGFYEKVLEVAEGDPVAEGEALHDLADIAAAEDDREGAVEIYREALDRKREGGGDVGFTLLLLGRNEKRLKHYAEAEAAFGERLELLRAESERRPLAEAVTLHDLADVRIARDEVEAAVELYGEAAGLKREAGAEADLATTLQALGGALTRAGRVDEAADIYAECVRLLGALSEPDPLTEAIVLGEFADLHRQGGDLEEAESLYRRALSLGPFERDPLLIPFLLYRLAGILELANNPAEAEEALHRRLAILHELDGVDWQEGITLVDIGRLREGSEDLTGALEYYREGAAKLADSPSDVGRAFALKKIGDGLASRGDLEEAIDAYEEAIALWNAEGQTDRAMRTLLDLGRVQYERGDYAAAASRFEERLDYLRRLEEPNRRAQGIALHHLADARRAEGRSSEAIGLYRDAAAHKREAGDEANLATTLTILAVTLLEVGEGEEDPGFSDEAAAARADAAEAISAALADPDARNDPETARLLVRLAAMVDDTELISSSLEALCVLAADEKSDSGPAHEFLLDALHELGRKGVEDGDLERAEALIRERLSLLVEHPQAGPNPRGITSHDLARVLERQGRRDEAIALYREAVELKRQAGNELGVARSLFALAKQLHAAGDREAREVVAQSVELFRGQADEAGPLESSAALELFALLEEDTERALAALGEARDLVESMPAEEPHAKTAKQSIAAAEEAVKRRSDQSGSAGAAETS